MIFVGVKSACPPPVRHQAKWPQRPIYPLAVPETRHHRNIIFFSHYHIKSSYCIFAIIQPSYCPHTHLHIFSENQQGKSLNKLKVVFLDMNDWQFAHHEHPHQCHHDYYHPCYTGYFCDWYPPKKLGYGKPRLGESTS